MVIVEKYIKTPTAKERGRFKIYQIQYDLNRSNPVLKLFQLIHPPFTLKKYFMTF